MGGQVRNINAEEEREKGEEGEREQEKYRSGGGREEGGREGGSQRREGGSKKSVGLHVASAISWLSTCRNINMWEGKRKEKVCPNQHFCTQ